MDKNGTIEWSFEYSNGDHIAHHNLELLPNGNRLITESDFGFWEVSDEGEILWRFTDEGFFWRGYHFEKDAEGVINLNL